VFDDAARQAIALTCEGIQGEPMCAGLSTGEDKL
jgi:hypothetical protein